MTNKKKLVDIIYLVGQPLLLNVIGMPATAYFIRTLGPSGWGRYSLGVFLIGLFTFVTNLGLRPRFLRIIAQFPERAAIATAEQLGLRTLLALLAGLLAILLCLVFRYPLVVLHCVIVGAFGLIMVSVATVLQDVLQGFKNFKVYSAVNLVAGIVVTAITVVAVWEGTGPLGLTIAYLSGVAMTLMLLVIAVQRYHIPIGIRGSYQRYRELLHDSRNIGLSQLTTSIQENIERLLLPKITNIDQVGYFSAGTYLTSRLPILPDGVATAYYPNIAEKSRTEEQQVPPLVAQLLSLSLVVCLPIAILIAYHAAPIAVILFPKDPLLCENVIEITIWAIPLMGLSMSMTYAMQAANHHDQAARALMLSTVVSCASSILLVVYLGVTGASWAMVLRYAIQVILLFYGFMRAFPGIFTYLSIGRICVCAGSMGLVLWFFRPLTHISPLFLLLGTALASLIYVGALF